jgi:hypothetical protein
MLTAKNTERDTARARGRGRRLHHQTFPAPELLARLRRFLKA